MKRALMILCAVQLLGLSVASAQGPDSTECKDAKLAKENGYGTDEEVKKACAKGSDRGSGGGGAGKVDTDKDGVPDAKDKCPGTAAGDKPDENGCSPAQKEPSPDGSVKLTKNDFFEWGFYLVSSFILIFALFSWLIPSTMVGNVRKAIEASEKKLEEFEKASKELANKAQEAEKRLTKAEEALELFKKEFEKAFGAMKALVGEVANKQKEADKGLTKAEEALKDLGKELASNKKETEKRLAELEAKTKS